MTKDVVLGSRNKSYSDQCQLVAEHSQRTGRPYKVPHILEGTVSILMHYVKTGEPFYTDDKLGKQFTWTRCQEKVNDDEWLTAIGGFDVDKGLIVFENCSEYNDYGVGGARRLLPPL